MVLREKVLRKKVEKLELKGLQHNKVIPERLSGLENLLDDVFLTRRPKPSDYDSRRDLVRVFNEIAKELYGDRENCPAVEEFGSFVMDLFSSKSDLDLSVNFSKDAAEFSRDKKIKTLRKFASKFYLLKRKGHVSGVQPILTARVPILKVIDTGTGIECDISVENRDGVLKSQIIHIISSIDERFQKLCFLVKSWASAHGINSSKDRTLNSLSLILLVTFHLQTRNPPILPPFSALFKDGTDPASVVKSVNNFLNCGKGNKESLANLFVTLLIKLSSVEALWSKGLCVSTYQGAWISKTWDSKVGCISVEDFTDRSQNVARAVGMQEAKKINQCIRLSIQHVFDFMNGLIQEPELRGFLFGSDAPIPTPVVDKGPTNRKKPKPKRCKPPTHGRGGMQQATPFNPTLKRGPQVYERIPTVLLGPPVQQVIMPFDPTLTKRMRVNEGWGGNPTETWRATSSGSWGGKQNHQVGWGGMRTVNDTGPVWSNEMQSMGWGGPQQASIPSFGPRLRPAFVPQPDLQLRNINQVIPSPPYVVNSSVDPNLRHGPPPPFNPYGTR